jgi:hypothetical protein
LAGCAGSPSNNLGSGGDAGQAAPQIVYGPPGDAGGLPGVLSSLQIVTTTWTRDPEDITAQIAAAFAPSGIQNSAWWAALSKYCVPGATPCVGGTVSVTTAHIGDAPAYPINDSAIAQSTQNDSFARFLRDKSKPALNVLPAPSTANTLYVIFMPLSLPADQKGPGLQPGYEVTVDGAASCGYHSASMSGAGPNVAYVVVPRCQVPGQSNADVAIATAFREIADAVTDPFRALGSMGFHNALSPPGGFEIGDVCSGTTGAANGIAGFSVPKIWSNASMSCVP